ncbi:hypothetical protein H6G89_04690 [Oscillatoria sp. FACHB-1407]|uniref:hypothetical protein n=1 Tax=Oscillatoria sp. FACHB-1407 TaxID=2692847 RepID=UPI0016821110|nr:hypothetical protein [Oscillatoria sp. FACHB-1407]MBD2460335.1 hypothetical protein [Oscillatoria sp. FACHB-1407]
MQRFILVTSMLALLNAGAALADSTAIASNTTVQPADDITLTNANLIIDTQGYVRDMDRALLRIAQITSTGDVRQANGNALGQIAENGSIYDANGDLLGRVDEIGYIYDRQNRILALHDISGYLLNVDGTLMRNQRISRDLVVFLFFFQ